MMTKLENSDTHSHPHAQKPPVQPLNHFTQRPLTTSEAAGEEVSTRCIAQHAKSQVFTIHSGGETTQEIVTCTTAGHQGMNT